MVSGGARGRCGGGQIGRGRSPPPAPARSPPRRSWSGSAGSATRIRGSYRYLRQGLQSTLAFQRCESQYYRQLQFPSSRYSSSASCAPPPRRLNFGEASSSRGPRPVPRFDPGDYVDDDDIPMLVAELERNAPALTADNFVPELERNAPALTADNFVPASILGTVTALLEEKTRRDAEKAEEWRREQEAQDAKYVEISDESE